MGSLKAISLAMLVTYAVESCVRLYVLRSRFIYYGWNVFDALLVSADVVGSVLEHAIGDVPSFAIFRLFRVVRVVRPFRALKNFRELFMMLHGLAAAMKAIMWATFMLIVAFLFWALVAVEMIHPLVQELDKSGKLDRECTRCPVVYRSVWEASLTLV